MTFSVDLEFVPKEHFRILKSEKMNEQKDDNEREWEYLNNYLHQQLPNDNQDNSEWLKISGDTIMSIMEMLNRFILDCPDHFGAILWIEKINTKYFSSINHEEVSGAIIDSQILYTPNISVKKGLQNNFNNNENKTSTNKSKITLLDYYNPDKSKKNKPNSAENIIYPEILSDIDTIPITKIAPVSTPVIYDTIFDMVELDPGLRSPIYLMTGQNKENLIDAYICKGPHQPLLKSYPINSINKSFQTSWYTKFIWLEYSESQDKVFCFPCFLFINNPGDSKFTSTGYNNWDKALDKSKGMTKHIGNIRSVHNLCVEKMYQRSNKKAHLEVSFIKMKQDQENQDNIIIRISIKACIWLALQGLAFRGHDESDESYNRGNFLEFISFIGTLDENLASVLVNAPQNAKYTSPQIQKEIIYATSEIIVKQINDDIGTKYYSIIADEAQCYAKKQWISCVIRYINDNGQIIERFLDLVHIKDTKSLTLYGVIMSMLKDHSLDPKRMRGQAYDGANNMRGEINGLQALIKSNNESAIYIHCFAHRLNLILVSVSKDYNEITSFFMTMESIYNIIGASCKRMDLLRDAQAKEIQKDLSEEQSITGSGINQSRTVKPLCDTR